MIGFVVYDDEIITLGLLLARLIRWGRRLGRWCRHPEDGPVGLSLCRWSIGSSLVRWRWRQVVLWRDGSLVLRWRRCRWCRGDRPFVISCDTWLGWQSTRVGHWFWFGEVFRRDGWRLIPGAVLCWFLCSLLYRYFFCLRQGFFCQGRRLLCIFVGSGRCLFGPGFFWLHGHGLGRLEWFGSLRWHCFGLGFLPFTGRFQLVCFGAVFPDRLVRFDRDRFRLGRRDGRHIRWGRPFILDLLACWFDPVVFCCHQFAGVHHFRFGKALVLGLWFPPNTPSVGIQGSTQFFVRNHRRSSLRFCVLSFDRDEVVYR